MEKVQAGLLKPLVMETAFLKVGLYGFAGSGKTFTASRIVRGLLKLQKKKVAAFFDTEKGSDFEANRFKEAGFTLVGFKSRSFKDLLSVMRESEAAGYPIIIDSISHVWRELCDSYQRKYSKKSLSMYDWGILKAQWREFTDLYVNSKNHVFMCGRGGFEYDVFENEDTGKQEISKTGTKMKVEGETGFESDLLLEMERFDDPKVGLVNRCWVVKDRSARLQGKCLVNPDFKDFKPYIDFINLGGEHRGVDISRSSDDLFADPDWSYADIVKRRSILLENLKGTLSELGMDGTSKEATQKRYKTLERFFGTMSATEMENMHPKKLEQAYSELKNHFHSTGELKSIGFVQKEEEQIIPSGTSEPYDVERDLKIT